MIDIDRLQGLMRKDDWSSVYTMLDAARQQAVTDDEIKREVYWRMVALENQRHYEEAIDFLQSNSRHFNSQCLVHQNLASFLLKLGRNKDALDELSKAPFEEEMEDFYGSAIDAKFLYFYLLAKSGDRSIKDRLSEIPDDYRHITMDGKFLTKPDIVAVLER
jgi:tetratricopeptide (TPR) repeat protein